MKHGKYYRYTLLLLACLSFCLLLLIACRSSRNMVEETSVELHASARTDAAFDSISAKHQSAATGADSTRQQHDGEGSVEIRRDSAGRPVFIYWRFAETLSSLATRSLFETGMLSGFRTSGRSGASLALDSVNEKTEEVAQEIDTAISLEEIIGPGLIALVLLYLIYLFLTNVALPWIRQQRNP